MGINFQVNPKQLEKSLKKTENFYGITSLIDKNKNQSPILLVQNFLNELENIIELLNQEKRKIIIKNWTKKSSSVGKNITISTYSGKINGKAIKLDDDGALVIKNNKNTQRILAGDLIHPT